MKNNLTPSNKVLQVGDLVRHYRYPNSLGIVLELCLDIQMEMVTCYWLDEIVRGEILSIPLENVRKID